MTSNPIRFIGSWDELAPPQRSVSVSRALGWAA
jgi:hypothetical protein